MQQIALYIEGQRLDLFEDESLSITDSIQNIRDIGKLFTPFSTQFSLPASKTNNNIFKHYYNADVIDGFDARFKVDAEITVNGITYKTGRLKLNTVSLKNNVAYAYKVVFYGNIVALADKLGEDMLEDLSFLYNFGVRYNYTNVKEYLANGFDKTVDGEVFTDAVVIPLITHTQRLFYDEAESPVTQNNLFNGGTNPTGVSYRELKPAIRIDIIIKAIEEEYGITFSDDFFSASNVDYYNLYMWLHRAKGDVYERIEGLLTDRIDTLPTTTWNGVSFNGISFTINDIFTYGAQRYTLDLSINTSVSNNYTIIIKRGSQIIFRTNELTGTGVSTLVIPDLILNQNGTYTIDVEAENPITLSGNINLERLHYYDATVNQNFAIGSFSLLDDYSFVVNQQIPKMKVIDFLSGLFKTFNLTAYEQNGVIVVRSIDDFFSEGVDYDITRYIDVMESEISSSSLYKQINFDFKGTKSLQADKHNELFKYNWGGVEYIADEQIEGTVYKIESPFEHMKYERLVNGDSTTFTTIQWGWSTDNLNEDGTASPYLGSPLLFYPIRLTGTPLRINDGSVYDSISTYHIPSNSISITDSFSLHFNAEVNEYSLQVMTNTIFEKYYRSYLEDIFDPKRRIYNYKCYLPIWLTLKYKMNDRFVISGRRFKINSIGIDLKNGMTNLELINEV